MYASRNVWREKENQGEIKRDIHTYISIYVYTYIYIYIYIYIYK